MADTRDPRTLRLYDLEPFESVVVTCRCGWIVSYGTGLLQRRHRISSDTLLYDLQFRLRCSHCNRRDGFKIAVQDTRHIGTGSQLPEPRVVVEPGEL